MEPNEDRKPGTPPARGRPLQLELSEKEAEGIYANLCVISHSSSEFILDFARAVPGVSKSRVYARIIMTPQHAKSLLGALGQNLRKFEEQFGPIPTAGEGGDPDRKPIGF